MTSDDLPTFSPVELQEAQKKDSFVGEVWRAISLKKPAGCFQTTDPVMKLFKREWYKLSIEKGLLFHGRV